MELENELLLDDTWIKEFEILDKEYEKLYNSDTFFVNVHFLYINKENVIESVKEQKFMMTTPNYIYRDEIVGLIKRNYIRNENKYILLSILKYNFKLLPENLNTFLKEEDVNNLNFDFFTPIKNIDTIKFEKTIDMFQDLNDLFFVFYEKTITNSNSEKNYDDNQNQSQSISNNVLKSDFYTNIVKNHSYTKRIFLQKSQKKKKTQRKTV